MADVRFEAIWNNGQILGRGKERGGGWEGIGVGGFTGQEVDVPVRWRGGVLQQPRRGLRMHPSFAGTTGIQKKGRDCLTVLYSVLGGVGRIWAPGGLHGGSLGLACERRRQAARQRTKAKRSLAGQRGRRDQKRFPPRGFLHKNSLPRWQTWRGAESDRAAGRDGWTVCDFGCGVGVVGAGAGGRGLTCFLKY